MKTLLLGLGMVLLLSASCTKVLHTTDEEEIFKQKLLQANNAFSIKTLQQTHLRNDSSNLVLSPFSVSVALSFAANGAEGNTRDAIIDALEMQGLSLADVNQSTGNLLQELATSDPAVELSLANALWYQNGLGIKSPFEQINQLYYKVTLQQLDFTNPTAIEIINNWVRDATAGNVQQIVDQLTADQGLYIVSNLWFNARFKQAFDSTLTTQQPFYIGNTQTVPVQMMSGRGMSYGYFADNDVKIADLPYESGVFSFTILMPSDASNIDQFINNLSVSKWDTWMNGLSYHSSPNLYLPKFSVGYNGLLKPLMSDLGMENAFTDQANYTNITDAALTISDVKHKTSLTVSEEGVIATDATVTASTTFSVNKPFVIAVREKYTGRVLMIGKIVNPAI